MKTRIDLILSGIIFLLILSCGGGNQEREGTASNFKLEIVDSLQFNILTQSLRVADVDTETGDMLIIRSAKPAKAWLFDKNNNVLAEFERPDGDPEGTGQYILTGTFFDDGIALMGSHVVNIYDRPFNFIKAMRPHFSPSSLIYLGTKNIFEFRDDGGNPQLATYFGKPQLDVFGDRPEFYEKFNIVDVVNPALSNDLRDTVFMPLGELTPDSRYLQGKAFHFLAPKFDVKNNRLYYALNDDTTLFIRNLPQGDILDSYTIPFDKYILSEGVSLGSKGIAEMNQKRDRAGRIESVFHSDGFEVVVYHSGLKMSEMAVYEGSEDVYDKLNSLDYKKYLILKNGKRVNSDLKVDPRVFYVYFADDDGYFYGSQNPGVLSQEPELYTIYKLRIVADE